MTPIVRALLDERAGYVRRGLTDRVGQVDAQLAKHGFEVIETTASDPLPETAVPPRPTPRRSKTDGQ